MKTNVIGETRQKKRECKERIFYVTKKRKSVKAMSMSIAQGQDFIAFYTVRKDKLPRNSLCK